MNEIKQKHRFHLWLSDEEYGQLTAILLVIRGGDINATMTDAVRKAITFTYDELQKEIK